MPDHGRPLRFGLSLVPEAESADAVMATVLAAEAEGLDLVGIQDHPYQSRFLDTWTLLAVLAARTERIAFFPDVANLPLRPAPMLAKAAATLDRLSGGRVELGLGAGTFWDGVQRMGGPRLTPKESVDAVEAAIGTMRAFWAGEPHGSGPAPAHDIGIWLGAYGPRMLRITGRLADGWVPSLSYLPAPKLAAASAAIDEAARSAGRDPAAITRAINVGGTIGDAPEGEEKVGGMSSGDGAITGDADHWARALASLAIDAGIDTFVYWPPAPEPVHVEAFARDVVPKVLDVVATYRNP
jgi:alkanesulfonate monooxygenase SsuD/methylene tetrahydromethanopterin reductase-like flavin-dependent oxidoreductase (luciferase family)